MAPNGRSGHNDSVPSVGRRRRAVVLAALAPLFVLATLLSLWLGLSFVAFCLWAGEPVGAVVLAILFGTLTLGIAWRGFVIARWLVDRTR